MANTEETKAIGEIFGQWCQSVLDGDMDALAYLMTEDYESWPAGTPVIRGRKAVIQGMRAACAAATIQQSFECHDLAIDGKLAVACGIESFVLTMKPGGEARKHRQRAVVMMRKCDDEQWRFFRGITSPLPAQG